ncbi:hypothetical protein EX30DRAFT_337656 [Ascodesmis nigricans]|uniref:Uncharacterized protein n=1 Tax=Ascodesmis nigricans TaxID=341454 RepID=A0A4S2N7Y2_9PEZI|nr:hypothetical protein EX30DRAFT_337656 [Ascodesmis nigricans]
MYTPLASATTANMISRKPSLSSTPSYITQGLAVNTLHTPIEELSPPPPSASHSSSNLASYFSLHRSGSHQRRGSNTTLHGGGATPQSSSSLPTSSSGQTVVASMNAVTTLPLPPPSPHAHYQSVHDICTKRIATLDYLRRAHEGRVFWFNTHLIPRQDLSRILHSDTKKLYKRAANLFILGNSLPNILEIGGPGGGGAPAALEFMKAWYQLLQEYETYIALPPGRREGRSHAGSVSMGSGSGSGMSMGMHSGSAAAAAAGAVKLKTLFSRRQGSRRGSTAASDFERARSGSVPGTGVMPMPSLSDDPMPLSLGGMGGSGASGAAVLAAASGQQQEEYMYLSTATAAFQVDFFEVFATLCDVLIEVYSKVLKLVDTPQSCGQGVGEGFVKADGKVKRLVVGVTVREWEDAVRTGVKREIVGIGREVLGGMM